MKNTLWVSALFIAATLALGPSLWADTIAPGGSGSPDDLLFTGAVTSVGSTGNLTLSIGGAVSTEVISDPANEFCSGCFDFESLRSSFNAAKTRNVSGQLL